ERRLLEPLVRKHLEKHGENAGQSLAALGRIDGIPKDLEEIADPDLKISLEQPREAATAAEPRPASDAGGKRRTSIAVAGSVLATTLLALAAGFVMLTLQKQETQRQRLRAEANLQKAADSVERLLARIGQERLKGLPHMESLRSE